MGGPVDWLKHDAERVEALGMDFHRRERRFWRRRSGRNWRSGRESNGRADRDLFNWTPNFIEARLSEGKFVEFPEYFEGCKDDASQGPEPERHL